MDMHQDGQVIYLKDLFFAALYKWKAIITIALALAVILGAGKGVLSFISMKNTEAQQTNSYLEEMELEVFETKKATLQQQIDVNRENARHQQEYLDNSILMNIDPYNFYEVYLSIYVDNDYQIIIDTVHQNPDLLASITHSYIEYILGEQSVQALADAIETEPEYLLELMSAEAPYDARSLKLRATAPDAQSAQLLLDLLLQHVQNIQPKVTEIVGEHELRIKEQYIRQTMDKELAASQQEQVDKLTELNDSILSLQEEKDNLLPPKPIVVSSRSVIKDTAIFAVVGGILGILFTVMFAWVCHMTSNKVYSVRTLVSRTGLRVLGCICVSAQKSKLDRKLAALEGRNTTNAEKQCALLACSISALCGSAKQLMITGQTASVDRGILVDALRQAMPGVQILDNGNLLEDIAARKALDPETPILLIDQCGISTYSGVEQSVEIATSHSATIIGCVLLDG